MNDFNLDNPTINVGDIVVIDDCARKNNYRSQVLWFGQSTVDLRGSCALVTRIIKGYHGTGIAIVFAFKSKEYVQIRIRPYLNKLDEYLEGLKNAQT